MRRRWGFGRLRRRNIAGHVAGHITIADWSCVRLCMRLHRVWRQMPSLVRFRGWWMNAIHSGSYATVDKFRWAENGCTISCAPFLLNARRFMLGGGCITTGAVTSNVSYLAGMSLGLAGRAASYSAFQHISMSENRGAELAWRSTWVCCSGCAGRWYWRSRWDFLR